jgi:hypothetical protein
LYSAARDGRDENVAGADLCVEVGEGEAGSSSLNPASDVHRASPIHWFIALRSPHAVGGGISVERSLRI